MERDKTIQPCRVELPLDGLYLIIDKPHNGGFRESGYRHVGVPKIGEDVQRIHLMSSHARGEIRSYGYFRGQIHIGLPCYTKDWSEMDQHVANALGAPVVGYDGAVHVPGNSPGQLALFDGTPGGTP